MTDPRETTIPTPARRLRRQLLKGAAGTLLAGALAYVGWTRYLFPPPAPAPPRRPGGPASGVRLGPVAAFVVGAPPAQVQITPPGTDRVDTYLVENLGGGQFRVLSAVCTHLGCIVAWSPQGGQFVCPCHAARYDLAGKNVAGPAPRPLPALPWHVQGDTLYLAA